MKQRLAFLLILMGITALLYITKPDSGKVLSDRTVVSDIPKLLSPAIAEPTITPPPAKTLTNDYHIIQSFNNCGPASLSMALSYFGIDKTQGELGEALRPYQHPTGDNDDKSVTFSEMADKAKEYGLLTYHRPNGDISLLKQFIIHDIPVITRTWLHPDEDIGHYRIVNGYDDETQVIIQDDSYEGANLTFSYDDFNTIWSKFEYEYLVLVPKEKKATAEAIIGTNLDEMYAWKTAVDRNLEILAENQSDIYSRFNLSVAYYYSKDYQKSVDEYEKVAHLLPFRTLWYQNEPIRAYYELGEYEKVFTISDTIFNTYNRAYSELYILRGNIYRKQNDLQAAKMEYEKAVYYNRNLQSAVEAYSAVD